ncbi:MAG: hypothetical protein F4X65_07920 [Chloroflexi bacterium]|nr:hypothetical protein [Chloroflexota bacterium]
MSLSREIETSREKQVITDGLVPAGTTIGGEVGTFYVDFTLWSGDGTRSLDLNGLVDTGASYTMVPAPLLDDLGVAREESLMFRLADGSTREYDTGLVVIDLEGRSKSVYVVFGPENRILLGAMALEAFALAADAKNHRLVPADLTL